MKIQSFGNIHQHLDLIAGLPYENYKSFENSFNDVYSIRPEKLQLGFLKLLKGSGLRMKEKEYNFKYLDKPPYEILENSYISYSDIIKFKGIEDLVEKYYNEGYFLHSLEFIIRNNYTSPFKFYEEFSMYWEECQLYLILLDYFRFRKFEYEDIFTELLKLDYICNNSKQNLPTGIIRSVNNLSQANLHLLLKNSELIAEYLTEYKDVPTKQIVNKIIVEEFDYDVFKTINNEYKPYKVKNPVYLLFKYNQTNMNRYETYNITNYVREMI